MNATADEGGASASADAAGLTTGWYARQLPAVLIALGVIAELAAPPEYTILTPFIAAPLVAASLCSAWATVAIGLVAWCSLAVFVFFYDVKTTTEAVIQIVAMSAVVLLALGTNRLARRRNAMLASARGIAEAAQLAVLPTPPQRIGPLDIAARYRAAHTDARIGGDLYAVQNTPFGVRLIVGDVRGKGLNAVATVSVVLGAFREAADDEATLEGVAARLERAMRRDAVTRTDLEGTEGFTTAVVVEVPAGRPDRIRLVNRGHPSPLMLHGGTARFVEPGSFALPLGMSDLGDWPDQADVVPFPHGAQLLLYTDGLSEARDGDGTFYAPDRRLAGRGYSGPHELLDTVLADVTVYTAGGSSDDLALLALQRRRTG